MNTLEELLASKAKEFPEHEAILGVEGSTFSYTSLYRQVTALANAMHRWGINRNDRVAVVLPDGPTMAITFLAVAIRATIAPLNPAGKKRDFSFYLDQLKAKAVIVPASSHPVVESVAKELDIPIWRIHPDLALEGGINIPQGDSVNPGPEDIALILHTSGTTSRPKMVPLSNQNLVCSAQHISKTLKLSPQDRCLGIMPLFHIHGLIGGLLSSLCAGSSIVCTPPFDATRFIEWANQFSANWYTAVPTMHQAILTAAVEEPIRPDFRFIRSSSAALPPAALTQMEQFWNTPVIESYGMTEACHQMTSNPLPPAKRKTGSVGLAAGPKVAILAGSSLAKKPDEIGEVVIQGPNVFKGYADNAAATETAFFDGWFRTGDQGHIDEEGYLFLTGRLKEMINRGGENIAPREVDEVLMEHQAVKQAVAFAVPHSTLGEDLAAAVVLDSGEETPSEQSLREFAAERLTEFKLPTRILIVDTIPKGPTGKLQRIGLHEKLAAHLKSEYAKPQTRLEEWIADAMSQELEIDLVGRHDNFFSLGGDSIKATRVVVKLRRKLDQHLPISILFRFPTIALLGKEIESAETDDELERMAKELSALPPEEIERLLSDEQENEPIDGW